MLRNLWNTRCLTIRYYDESPAGVMVSNILCFFLFVEQAWWEGEAAVYVDATY